MKNISISFIKIIISSIIMGITSKISFETLSNIADDNISLIISVGIGALVYGILIYFMKIEEVDVLIISFKNKISKKER